MVNVLLAREGYLPAWVAGVEAPTAKPLAVALEPASLLRGRVEDVSGEPVPGASVRLRPGTAAARDGRRGDAAIREHRGRPGRPRRNLRLGRDRSRAR